MATITAFPIESVHNNALNARGALRSELISVNGLIVAFANFLNGLQSDVPVNSAIPTAGTTVTMSSPAQTILIAGVPTALAAISNQVFGALGTIPASKWGVIALDRVAAGTLTYVSGAANYTTGYATEALAIAAEPAKTANKARTGYITILASASGWVAGTDALQGNTGGNPATTTHYFANLGYTDALFWPNVSAIANTENQIITVGIQ